jgi:hypothetical protein
VSKRFGAATGQSVICAAAKAVPSNPLFQPVIPKTRVLSKIPSAANQLIRFTALSQKADDSLYCSSVFSRV